jgi:hypothetical protein
MRARSTPNARERQAQRDEAARALHKRILNRNRVRRFRERLREAVEIETDEDAPTANA